MNLTKILHTTGNGYYSESTWEVPELKSNEILVEAILTGVCRSDIDMMLGKFGPLPLNMQGHEGLGKVIKLGSNISDVNIGDVVATRGEPAYADIYPCREREYVKVPKVSPKYILEPVACGINLILQPLDQIKKREGNSKKLLIIGSGFLAWVAYTKLKVLNLKFDITVIGNSNKKLWGDILSTECTEKYDVVIDLGSNADVFQKDIIQDNALIILGSQKEVTTDFSNLLWKAATMIFPSPRTDNFYQCMQIAEQMITSNQLKVDSFWSRGYNRTTEWEQAFVDGADRPKNYSRGYIKWR